MVDPDNLAQIKSVKQRYELTLMQKANVVAVGVGVPIRDGKPAVEPGIVVSVTHKVPLEELSPHDKIPKHLEGVRVWVQAVGTIEAKG